MKKIYKKLLQLGAVNNKVTLGELRLLLKKIHNDK